MPNINKAFMCHTFPCTIKLTINKGSIVYENGKMVNTEKESNLNGFIIVKRVRRIHHPFFRMINSYVREFYTKVE